MSRKTNAPGSRLLLATAAALAGVFAFEAQAAAQAYSDEDVVECIVLGEYGPEAGLCVVPDHETTVALGTEYTCFECMDPVDLWRWQQAISDRAHQAYIDAIWDRDYADQPYRETGYHPGHTGNYPAYGGYYPAYGGHYAPHGPYNYWDPMQSWYRRQAANDRAHAAFIDYIRN